MSVSNVVVPTTQSHDISTSSPRLRHGSASTSASSSPPTHMRRQNNSNNSGTEKLRKVIRLNSTLRALGVNGQPQSQQKEKMRSVSEYESSDEEEDEEDENGDTTITGDAENIVAISSGISTSSATRSRTSTAATSTRGSSSTSRRPPSQILHSSKLTISSIPLPSSLLPSSQLSSEITTRRTVTKRTESSFQDIFRAPKDAGKWMESKGGRNDEKMEAEDEVDETESSHTSLPKSSPRTRKILFSSNTSSAASLLSSHLQPAQPSSHISSSASLLAASISSRSLLSGVDSTTGSSLLSAAATRVFTIQQYEAMCSSQVYLDLVNRDAAAATSSHVTNDASSSPEGSEFNSLLSSPLASSRHNHPSQQHALVNGLVASILAQEGNGNGPLHSSHSSLDTAYADDFLPSPSTAASSIAASPQAAHASNSHLAHNSIDKRIQSVLSNSASNTSLLSSFSSISNSKSTSTSISPPWISGLFTPSEYVHYESLGLIAYIKACQENCVPPVTQVVESVLRAAAAGGREQRGMQASDSNASLHSLSSYTTADTVDSLTSSSPTPISLNLQHYGLSEITSYCLGVFLRYSQCITELDCSCNNLGNSGVQQMARGMLGSEEEEAETEGETSLSSIFPGNTSLLRLILNSNNFEHGASLILQEKKEVKLVKRISEVPPPVIEPPPAVASTELGVMDDDGGITAADLGLDFASPSLNASPVPPYSPPAAAAPSILFPILSHFGRLLLSNTTLRTLHLTNCHLSDRHLADFIPALDERYRSASSTSCSGIVELRLDQNNISDRGAKFISEVLLHNSTLTYLDLRYNCIRETGGVALAQAVGGSSTDGNSSISAPSVAYSSLRTLLLSHNGLSTLSGLAFASAISSPQFKLNRLDLEANQISGTKTWKEMMKAVVVDQKRRLDGNGEEGGNDNSLDDPSSQFKSTPTLLHINLSGNRLAASDAMIIAQAQEELLALHAERLDREGRCSSSDGSTPDSDPTTQLSISHTITNSVYAPSGLKLARAPKFMRNQRIAVKKHHVLPFSNVKKDVPTKESVTRAIVQGRVTNETLKKLAKPAAAPAANKQKPLAPKLKFFLPTLPSGGGTNANSEKRSSLTNSSSNEFRPLANTINGKREIESLQVVDGARGAAADRGGVTSPTSGFKKGNQTSRTAKPAILAVPTRGYQVPAALTAFDALTTSIRNPAPIVPKTNEPPPSTDDKPATNFSHLQFDNLPALLDRGIAERLLAAETRVRKRIEDAAQAEKDAIQALEEEKRREEERAKQRLHRMLRGDMRMDGLTTNRLAFTRDRDPTAALRSSSETPNPAESTSPTKTGDDQQDEEVDPTTLVKKLPKRKKKKKKVVVETVEEEDGEDRFASILGPASPMSGTVSSSDVMSLTNATVAAASNPPVKIEVTSPSLSSSSNPVVNASTPVVKMVSAFTMNSPRPVAALQQQPAVATSKSMPSSDSVLSPTTKLQPPQSSVTPDLVLPSSSSSRSTIAKQDPRHQEPEAFAGERVHNGDSAELYDYSHDVEDFHAMTQQEEDDLINQATGRMEEQESDGLESSSQPPTSASSSESASSSHSASPPPPTSTDILEAVELDIEHVSYHSPEARAERERKEIVRTQLREKERMMKQKDVRGEEGKKNETEASTCIADSSLPVSTASPSVPATAIQSPPFPIRTPSISQLSRTPSLLAQGAQTPPRDQVTQSQIVPPTMQRTSSLNLAVPQPLSSSKPFSLITRQPSISVSPSNPISSVIVLSDLQVKQQEQQRMSRLFEKESKEREMMEQAAVKKMMGGEDEKVMESRAAIERHPSMMYSQLLLNSSSTSPPPLLPSSSTSSSSFSSSTSSPDGGSGRRILLRESSLSPEILQATSPVAMPLLEAPYRSSGLLPIIALDASHQQQQQQQPLTVGSRSPPTYSPTQSPPRRASHQHTRIASRPIDIGAMPDSGLLSDDGSRSIPSSLMSRALTETNSRLPKEHRITEKSVEGQSIQMKMQLPKGNAVAKLSARHHHL